ncbi:MAG: hypothetical protein AAGA88_07470 [Pseudomonadota bacterium]
MDGQFARAKSLNVYTIPALTLVVGVGVYFLLFQIVVAPFHPSTDMLARSAPAFVVGAGAPVTEVAAKRMTALYALAIPTILMALSALALAVVAFSIVLKPYGRGAQLLGVAAIPVGGLIGFVEQYANPIRHLVADCRPGSAPICPLDQAVAMGGSPPLLRAEDLDHIQWLVSLNSVVSVAALCLIGACVLVLSRSVDPATVSIAEMKARRAGLEGLLLVLAPVLVFSVSTTHGFHHLAAAMMAEPDATAYNSLASTGTQYWGAVYTIIIIVVAFPAVLSVTRDAKLVAADRLPDADFAARQEWRKKMGIEFAFRERVGVLLAAIAPVLTSPALDALRGFAG